MTKNEFIQRAALALYARDNSSEKVIVKYAKVLADEIEKVAPFTVK